MRRSAFCCAAAVVMGAAASAATAAPSFVAFAPIAGNTTSAHGVSADGSSIAVFSSLADPTYSAALRWTSSGITDLGNIGGTGALPRALNANGTVLVGIADFSTSSQLDGHSHAFRWSGGDMQDLGTLDGGHLSDATGVSADGSVVVGYSITPTAFRAFRWTQASGMQDIGTLGGRHAEAYAVSGDGQVIVGRSSIQSTERAFRWTSAGMQDLGTLGGFRSVGYATNSNGSIIVGSSGIPLTQDLHAFLWTASGMQDLGALPGSQAYAFGVSEDGSSVVGQATFGNLSSATLWTPHLGIVDLNQYLPTLGVNLSGWRLELATGVSADGSVITGFGQLNGARRGFAIIGIPGPGSCAVMLIMAAAAARQPRTRAD